LTQALADWIGAHTRPFAAIGGVPRLLVPDKRAAGQPNLCRDGSALAGGASMRYSAISQWLGSIPAQAGGAQGADCRVHPRAGGGAQAQAGAFPLPVPLRSFMGPSPAQAGGAVRARSRSAAISGPSPRRRGRHPQRVAEIWPHGSIPAQAGEPVTMARNSRAIRVHPRAGEGAPESLDLLDAP
jgi:hypothetical protein